MSKLNIMKTIEKNIGKINVRYDLDMESGREILDNSTGPWDLHTGNESSQSRD